MMRFVSRDAAPPAARPASARARDFGEIHPVFKAEAAAEQAARCAQCGVPFCQVHCPLSNNVPDWLRLAAEGDAEGAYRLSAATNPMPEICGRICPQDKLCEGACVIEQSGHGAVTIGAVEKHLTELAWQEGWIAPLTPGLDRGASIGIVGAGPAGLAAAERLRELGYAVTVYDRHDRIGGLLTYGIPNFKLDKSVVARRAERLIAGGVAFELNCSVGQTIAFDEVRERHDAVLIATGVYRPRPLDIPGGEQALAALDYLIAANRAGFGETANAAPSAKGKRVIVVGGGDTAMDCVRTAVRQGAASVSCLYRRDRANMPGSLREVGYAEQEGVRFDWLSTPKAFRTGQASGVSAMRMRLGAPDASGRQSVMEEDGGAYHAPGDVVIAALGFEAEDLPALFHAPQLETRSAGALRVDPKTFETSLPGVFAAGDIVRGASLVVWALREGLDAADAIHTRLNQRAARIAAE